MSNLSNSSHYGVMGRHVVNNVLIYNYLYIFIIFIYFFNSVLMLCQHHCITTFDQFDMTDDRLDDSLNILNILNIRYLNYI